MSTLNTRKRDKAKRMTCQITPTEECNISPCCTYCYEKNKDVSRLSVDVIKEIIASTFAASSEYDEIEFDFHGGEVALAFPVVREACEWLWGQHWNKPYVCFASTNGVLIKGQIRDWFAKHSTRFWLGLSLDGTREMHNLNRSNSYDDIDIAFFRDTWPTQTVKMTLSPKTLPSLAAGVKHIHALGFPLSANLAYGVTWESPGDTLLYSYAAQLRELIDYYLEHSEIPIPNLLSMPLHRLGRERLHPGTLERKKWCGAGDSMVCYSPQGKRYPCQAFMPSSAMDHGDRLLEEVDFSDDANFSSSECATCLIETCCPTCSTNNYCARGSLSARDTSLCLYRKLEAQATSFLYGTLLQDPEANCSTRGMTKLELACWAKGVLAVQQENRDVQRYLPEGCFT